MNRDETKDLLTRRLDLTGDSFNAGMLDSWAAMLDGISYGDAVVAMRRAATRHGHVRWHDFHEELVAHVRDRVDRHTEAAGFDCELCGGSGWKDSTGQPNRHTDAGNTSVEPCVDHVRPVYVTFEQGICIAAVACETEMRARGKTQDQIDDALVRHFGIGTRT